ncbi:MAG: type I 3-dehydroquinate dehydratase [Candidatus Aenigmarchaeota archaeon]|nr:type I 3-dehydroquinate dehydratase [Candidatus Aenigmarchaeota archaeon]MCK5699009.1 type I 3-dehydroquinate dehydratase [Candidatus Aenigmarchaeota archaeon]
MIVVPIISKKTDEAIKDIKNAKMLEADVVELRLDYFKSLTEEDLKLLLNTTNLPKIATCRRKKEGGYFDKEEKERLLLLKKAAMFGADYIDIEYDADFSAFKNIESKIICSYHNFKKTPELDELTEILQKCAVKKPFVVKIVTMAKKDIDNIIILEFLENSKSILSKKIKIVSFCMGEKGILSRILCMQHGSFFTFASLKKGKESASGQINIGLMKDINKLII